MDTKCDCCVCSYVYLCTQTYVNMHCIFIYLYMHIYIHIYKSIFWTLYLTCLLMYALFFDLYIKNSRYIYIYKKDTYINIFCSNTHIYWTNLVYNSSKTAFFFFYPYCYLKYELSESLLPESKHHFFWRRNTRRVWNLYAVTSSDEQSVWLCQVASVNMDSENCSGEKDRRLN